MDTEPTLYPARAGFVRDCCSLLGSAALPGRERQKPSSVREYDARVGGSRVGEWGCFACFDRGWSSLHEIIEGREQDEGGEGVTARRRDGEGALQPAWSRCSSYEVRSCGIARMQDGSACAPKEPVERVEQGGARNTGYPVKGDRCKDGCCRNVSGFAVWMDGSARNV